MVVGYRRGEFEMKDIIKAIAWGFAMLVGVVYTATMSYVPYMLLNETCWLTSKKVELLIPQVAELADLKIKVVQVAGMYKYYVDHKIYSSKTPLSNMDLEQLYQWAGDEGKEDNKSRRDEINRITRNACSGARYSNNLIMELGARTAREQFEILRQLANDSSRIHKFNFFNLFRLFSGVMGALGGAFLVYRLAKIQRYGVRSNVFAVLAIAPFLILIIFIMGYLSTGLDLHLGDPDRMAMAALCATLWIFLVYPVIFVTAKKHGGLKNLLFPKLH